MGVAPLPGTHPRALTVNHLHRVVKEARGFKLNDDPDPLGPNRMRLFSYYKPSLEAGLYSIEAEQIIESDEHLKEGAKKNSPLRIYNHKTGNPALTPQYFNVVAPQFSLDDKLINSYYPPDGHQDEARILPHLVLNDAYFPWERDAGVTIKGGRDQDLNPNKTPRYDDVGEPVYRSMVPWVALVSFDPSKLQLEQREIEQLKIPGFSVPVKPEELAKRAATCSYPMSVSSYLGMSESSRVNYEAGYKSAGQLMAAWDGPDGLLSDQSPTHVIFPKKSLFHDIFADVDGQSHNIESHKYMCHVGFPDAGVEADGLFSIIISRRAGNINLIKPETQIVHLISIEHIDSTWPAVKTMLASQPNTTDRIGLISLKSWIYTALPPNPINFIDTMSNLMQTQQMLRANELTLANLQKTIALNDSNQPSNIVAASKQVLKRLQLGYTLARWRAETGEESTALHRGLLVPQQVPWPPSIDWAGSSNTSKEYQVLDEKTGIMDLSYSSAWQLGKLLAISDSTFNAALMRFRSLVHGKASSQARKQVNDVTSRESMIKAFVESMSAIHKLADGRTGTPQRVRPVREGSLVTNLDNPSLLKSFRSKLDSIVNFQGSAETDIYNEFNREGANNSDWVVIFDWISEKLYLSGIPAHVLIPDPSYLPAEALRFFFIDDAWLDCLIDGALSAANHLEGDDDFTRLRIKQTYNVYLDKFVTDTKIKPQIPCSGFILRSALVKVMPEMRITVTWRQPDIRHSVCRYTKLDDSTLLCLLDRFPEELESIRLSQPPHQQRFSVGYDLEPEIPARALPDRTTSKTRPGVVKFQLRQLYTKTKKIDEEWPAFPKDEKPTVAQATAWFDFKLRCVKANKMASEINALLQTGSRSTDEYNDPVPTSSILGLELNDPSYYFVIVPQTPKAYEARDRQLWTGSRQPSPPLDHDVKPPGPPEPPSKAEPTIPVRPPPPPAPPSNTTITIPPSRTSPRSRTDLHMSDSDRLHLGQTTTTPIPRFEVNIWADYKPRPFFPQRNRRYSPTNHIPTQNKYFFDLTISVRRLTIPGPHPTASTPRTPARPKEICIFLPTTGLYESNSTTKLESLLTSPYDGPGAYMLDNQRFTPYLNATRDYLQIRLIPRSASSAPYIEFHDDEREAWTRNVSVRLGEADISPYRKELETRVVMVDERGTMTQPKRTVAVCPVYERYENPNRGPDLIARDSVNVVKFDGRDEGR